MDLINRLREKPTATKKTIAFITSGVVTLGIFGLWLMVFNYNLNPAASQATATVAKSENADVNPLSAFWSVVSKGWDSVAKNVNKETVSDANPATSTVEDTFIIKQ